MPVALLLSPLTHGAYHDAVEDVALAELLLHFPGSQPATRRVGELTFIVAELAPGELPTAARLSFVQGIFAHHGTTTDGTLQLAPLPVDPGWTLPRELVFGAKYRGKTHELFTLLALNVARQLCTVAPERATKVLDPMAGRGTTLLTAARCGLNAVGIEQDGAALGDLQRHVRTRCKLHRVRHTLTTGTVGPRNAKGRGRFVQVDFEQARIKLITGDARQPAASVHQERFPMIVSDLPYGVQHRGPGGWRDPSSVLRACAPQWAERLLPGGSLVLGFNALMPKRDVLQGIFEDAGLVPHPFAAPHRMSASILRELAVFTKPGAP